MSLKTLKPLKFSKTPQTLGEHLSKRRKELGLLLREAAEQMGVDTFTLGNWQKGKTKPASRLWPAIIAFLGYDPYPPPLTLGDHIRAERRRRGCSLDLFAHECGFDPATLALIEADAYSRIDARVRSSHKALQRRYGLLERTGLNGCQSRRPTAVGTGRDSISLSPPVSRRG